MTYYQWEGWLISLWPTADRNELNSSAYEHMQVFSVSHYADSLLFITCVVFLFQVIRQYQCLCSSRPPPSQRLTRRGPWGHDGAPSHDKVKRSEADLRHKGHYFRLSPGRWLANCNCSKHKYPQSYYFKTASVITVKSWTLYACNDSCVTLLPLP